MAADVETKPTVLVIFGASGDLTWRKLVPALYNLSLDGYLPDRFALLGLGRSAMSDDALRQHMRDGVDRFSRRGKTEVKAWADFSLRLAYHKTDGAEAFATLSDRLVALDKEWSSRALRIFYLAVPPGASETVAQKLDAVGLARNDRTRIVIEKPFGRDLASARALNLSLTKIFHETQIYRIDHYLGKETVQNILAFRFANILYEPVWDRRYIDHVQITVSEEVGVEHRGGYYDRAGALRDMMQNHLLQLLCLTAMEPPVSFEDNEIRNKKVDVLHAIRPIAPDRIEQTAVRGQYTGGFVRDERVQAYRQEPDVAGDSSTETFAALKLFVDNWRWQDVPFYLRTGKRLPAKASEVSIQFQRVPHQSFPAMAVAAWRPNRLVIRIQPDEAILLHFQAKRPGPPLHLSPVEMHFCYGENFKIAIPEAYETLLLDVMQGDATLFMRADQVEAAWSVLTPVLENWEKVKPVDFYYPAGTWGPEAAEALIVQDGRRWALPSILPKVEEKSSP